MLPVDAEASSPVLPHSGVRLGVETLGPAAILGLGPKQGLEQQRGPTRGGEYRGMSGRRSLRRARRADPGRAGP